MSDVERYHERIRRKEINEESRQRKWRGGRGEEKKKKKEEEDVFMKPKSRRSADAKRRIVIFSSQRSLSSSSTSSSSSSSSLHIAVRGFLRSRIFRSCRLPCFSLQSSPFYSNPFLSLSDARVRSSSCCLTSISVGCSPSQLPFCYDLTDPNDHGLQCLTTLRDSPEPRWMSV